MQLRGFWETLCCCLFAVVFVIRCVSYCQSNRKRRASESCCTPFRAKKGTLKPNKRECRGAWVQFFCCPRKKATQKGATHRRQKGNPGAQIVFSSAFWSRFLCSVILFSGFYICFLLVFVGYQESPVLDGSFCFLRIHSRHQYSLKSHIPPLFTILLFDNIDTLLYAITH